MEAKTKNILMGVALGIGAAYVINKMRNKKPIFSSADGDEFYSADGEDIYDFDADYELASGDEDMLSADGEDFEEAGGKGKKRRLKHWTRRVKVLTKKIEMIKSGKNKNVKRLPILEKKLAHAQAKVVKFSNA